MKALPDTDTLSIMTKDGCMFRHEKSGKCLKVKCNQNLCQFEHEEIFDDNSVDDSQENDDCHLCDQKCNNQEDLIVHLRTSHLDTFINMAETEDFYVE